MGGMATETNNKNSNYSNDYMKQGSEEKGGLLTRGQNLSSFDFSGGMEEETDSSSFTKSTFSDNSSDFTLNNYKNKSTTKINSVSQPILDDPDMLDVEVEEPDQVEIFQQQQQEGRKIKSKMAADQKAFQEKARQQEYKLMDQRNEAAEKEAESVSMQASSLVKMPHVKSAAPKVPMAKTPFIKKPSAKTAEVNLAQQKQTLGQQAPAKQLLPQQKVPKAKEQQATSEPLISEEARTENTRLANLLVTKSGEVNGFQGVFETMLKDDPVAGRAVIEDLVTKVDKEDPQTAARLSQVVSLAYSRSGIPKFLKAEEVHPAVQLNNQISEWKGGLFNDPYHDDKKAVLEKQILEQYPDDNLIRASLLHRVDPNKYRYITRVLSDEDLEDPKVVDKVEENRRYWANVKEGDEATYFEERSDAIDDFHAKSTELTDYVLLRHRMARLKEIDIQLSIPIMDNENIHPREALAQRELMLAEKTNLAHKLTRQRKIMRERGLPDGSNPDELNKVIEDGAEALAKSYQHLAQYPGIPNPDYDPRGVEIQKALEKGKVKQALEAGFELVSWAPVARVPSMMVKTAKGAGKVKSVTDAFAAGQQAQQQSMTQLYREAGVDLTNPVAIRTFLEKNPTLSLNAGRAFSQALIGNYARGFMIGKAAKKGNEKIGGNKATEGVLEKGGQKFLDQLNL
ncbi:hypothetical protein [Curvivirga aplysinae]|uniref:hypothetical protein n=1 Tax=Curvivirga aplysinae TaxID=2529852 RepID=UPI0012BC6B1F|nr:hypothetical protein [Curvivirga aplysinae]MTI11161.1 hypothetical protein [Curvivirga aplysinae]